MEGPQPYSASVRRYLDRLYAPGRGRGPAGAGDPTSFRDWQDAARDSLRRLVRLDRIEEDLQGRPTPVELGGPEDLGGFTRRRGRIETEPDVSVPFWLLRPKGDGPFPLALTPHGHASHGSDMYAGVVRDDSERQRMVEENRDVAVQAAERGFLAVAPATRGFQPVDVPDRKDRHGGRGCRSQLMHCLIAGRTAMAERVWDMQRLMDWATALPEADGGRAVMMGNSGGGMVTTYTAALDERVKVAVPSCSFAPLVSLAGDLHHCDCNVVPGILRWGEFWHVAGLIAPRHLCVVNGRDDPLFEPEEVDRAVAGVGELYALAGAPKRFQHRYGDGGHRFYKHLMWPFIERAMREL